MFSFIASLHPAFHSVVDKGFANVQIDVANSLKWSKKNMSNNCP
jgi:hypothetical protein